MSTSYKRRGAIPRLQQNEFLAAVNVTFDLVFVVLWPVEVHGGGVPIQRIDGVGVGEQLREERLKDVGEVWMRRRK